MSFLLYRLLTPRSLAPSTHKEKFVAVDKFIFNHVYGRGTTHGLLMKFVGSKHNFYLR
jgi:hypothetical protein